DDGHAVDVRTHAAAAVERADRVHAPAQVGHAAGAGGEVLHGLQVAGGGGGGEETAFPAAPGAGGAPLVRVGLAAEAPGPRLWVFGVFPAIAMVAFPLRYVLR
ncbi:hypothetical protein ADL03_07915, partial [Nocardia sp. NRRL S-836]